MVTDKKNGVRTYDNVRAGCVCLLACWCERAGERDHVAREMVAMIIHDSLGFENEQRIRRVADDTTDTLHSNVCLSLAIL